MARAELLDDPSVSAPIPLRPRSLPTSSPPRAERWSRSDTVCALAWFAVALAIRAPLVARIEGVLDDDQSVVAEMARDIAAGKRWPIFFDGQRYMGSLEAFTAAGLVRLFGPGPVVVALAPTLYFGLFVALQYGLWRSWTDRTTGHRAALIAAIGAPMLVLWSVAPRGGYTEILAWATATLWAYSTLTRPDAPDPPRWLEASWGLLLAIGYYLNPLAIVIYATLAVDWIFHRHGAELRRRHRRCLAPWIDRPWAALVWLAAAVLVVLALGVGCHVRTGLVGSRTLYVYGLNQLPAVAGILWVVAILGFLGWWTGFPRRLLRLLTDHPWGAAGGLAALGLPFCYHLRVLLGLAPRDPSLPMWIRAPWAIGANLRDGLRALSCLLGCDHREAIFTLISHPTFQRPDATWPIVAQVLGLVAPLVAGLVLTLIAITAWHDRHAWRALLSLCARPNHAMTVIAFLGLMVTGVLYLLQATSPDASSMRYLVIAWTFLPGLVAAGLQRVPRGGRIPVLAVLLVPWIAAQAALAADLDRPSPFRPLAVELQRRGVRGIVTQAPIALIITNLTDGRVGAMQYQPGWPRLRDRYAACFPPGAPIVCVVDPTYPGIPPEDLGRHLRELAQIHPGKVVRSGRVGRYELWTAERPLGELLEPPAGFVRSDPF